MPMMPREKIKHLKKSGFKIVGQNGSHVKMRNETTGFQTEVPYHSSSSLVCYEKEQKPFPACSDPTAITPEPDSFLVVIEFDMLAYKRRTNSRAVKKTLSIPEWMNEAAMAMDLNFSQVLQEALLTRICSQT